MRSALVAVSLTMITPPAAFATEAEFSDAAWTRERGRASVDASTTVEDRGFEDRLRVALQASSCVTAVLSVPVGQQEAGRMRRTGLRDATVAMRWMALDRIRENGRDRIALSGGLELPSGDPFGAVPLGSGSVDLVLVAAAMHESPRWYAWTEARRVDATPGLGAPESDSVSVDFAAGVQTSPGSAGASVLRFEGVLHAIRTAAARTADRRLSDSGGDVVSIGPGFVFEMSGYALRGGVQAPVFHSLRGFQEDPGWRGQVGFEVHR